MTIRMYFLCASKFHRQHGLKSSIKWIVRAVQNQVFYRRYIVFCRDLHRGDLQENAIPESFCVKRFDRISDEPVRLFMRIAEDYPEELLREIFLKRFTKEVCLWCLRYDNDYAGHVWVLTGRTMNLWFFSLMDHDIYLFDAMAFPNFRRLGLTSVILNHILRHYRSEGFDRAYLETRESNTPIIKLMIKHEFVRIGLARRRILRGQCRVRWWL